MNLWRQIWELTRVRLLLFIREPEAVFWVFVFPVVLAAVLGFAFREGEPQPSNYALIGHRAEAVAAEMAEVSGLERRTYADAEEARRALRKGAIDALIVAAEETVLRFDPARPEAELAKLRLERALSGEPEGDPGWRTDAGAEVGSRYIDFLFPGLLGMNLMGTGMWVIGFSIAELRQKRILRRLLVTPMRRSSFLVSFLLARLGFLVAEVLVLLACAVWFLDVPFQANLLGFLMANVLGGTVFAALGILACARVRTIQGASGMLNLVMVPMWLSSGIFFSYERFPEVLHFWIRLLPLTALNDLLRAMMLDGRGLIEHPFELAVQLAWGAIGFLLGLKLFRWE